jgi:hypothetical protein
VLVLIVAFAAAALSAYQLQSLSGTHLPALRDAQDLETTVSVTGAVLRRADLVRADSLADRFHVVAGTPRKSAAKQSEMQSYDASFVDYYVAARRDAQGTSMSDESDLSSAESAKLARGVLKERLDTGMAADRHVVESTSVGTLKLRIAVSALFALCAALALYLLAPRRRAPVPAEASIEAASSVASVEDPSHLQEAVRRMAARRRAVALATEQVAERNRQQIALLQEPSAPAAPALTVIRGDSRVVRTRVKPAFQSGKRALAGV